MIDLLLACLGSLLLLGMTYSRWSVGGCCGCADCTLLTGTTVDDWTVGSWTFGQVGNSEATGSGYAYTDVSAPGEDAAFTFIWSSTPATGDKARAIVQYTDDDNYLYTEVEQLSGGASHTLRIGRRDSGSDTTLASTTISLPVTAGVIAACYTDGDLIGWSSNMSLRATTTAQSGRKGAIWASATTTVEAVAYYDREDDCGPCYERRACTNHCVDNVAPRYLSFVVADVANVGSPQECWPAIAFPPPTNDCEDMNGTWILQDVFGSPCEYRAASGPQVKCQQSDGFLAGQMTFAAGINSDGPSNKGLQFIIQRTNAFNVPIGLVFYTWRSGSGDRLHCMTEFEGKAIPYVSGSGYCSWPTSVTCNGAA